MPELPGHRIAVTPTGEYATIDTTAARAAIEALHGADDAARLRAVDDVLAAPARWAPPVLCAVAAVLFASDLRDEAAFWFFSGQLRARFDANRCADPTAASAVGVLTERYGPPINRYAFADRAALRVTVARAVAWDRATPHDYDHRWINLHGMGAFGVGGGACSRPESEWEATAERTRTDHLRDLDAVLGGQGHRDRP